MENHGGYNDLPFLANFYDYIPAYSGRKDVDFYINAAQATPGNILELGCGTGRILLPTATAGKEIVGVDISEYMLNTCRQKIAALDDSIVSRIELVHADMTDFQLKRTFGLVTTPFRSFHHLTTVENQLQCLHCINQHLEIGGQVILDLFQLNFASMTNPQMTIETEDFSGVELPGGYTLKRTHRIAAFHRAQQYNEIELIFYLSHPDGKEERLLQSFPFRYFFRYEMEHLLDRCGFQIKDIYGNYDCSPLRDDSAEMIIVAQKVRTFR